MYEPIIYKPMLIGIAGGSCSGKTTIANETINCLLEISRSVGRDISGVIFKMDWFYKKQSHLLLEERKKINYDCPGAFDLGLFYKQIRALLRNEEVERPDYSYEKCDRVGTKIIKPEDLIVLEGTFTLYNKKIRDLIYYKFFVKTKIDECHDRRCERDVKERGRTLESVEKQWDTTVLPGYEDYILPSRKYADCIIKGEGDIKESIKPIVEVIKDHFNNKTCNREYALC